MTYGRLSQDPGGCHRIREVVTGSWWFVTIKKGALLSSAPKVREKDICIAQKGSKEALHTMRGTSGALLPVCEGALFYTAL